MTTGAEVIDGWTVDGDVVERFFAMPETITGRVRVEGCGQQDYHGGVRELVINIDNPDSGNPHVEIPIADVPAVISALRAAYADLAALTAVQGSMNV